MGAVILTFAVPPGLRRNDVVLPDAVLTRVERHALGVAAHRDDLLEPALAGVTRGTSFRSGSILVTLTTSVTAVPLLEV